MSHMGKVNPVEGTSWTIENKVCIVTGSNSGIGRQTALELAKRGAAKVILACRNVQSAEEVAKDIRQQVGYANEAEGSKRVIVKQLDLASLQSVRKFAADIKSSEQALHVLINNAGCECLEREETVDGFELTFQSNHLGHFLLTSLLLDLLNKSVPSRVIVVASTLYRMTWPGGFDINDPNQERQRFSTFKAYCQSKLANILFVRELHRRLNGDGNVEGSPSSGVSIFALHPGIVRSNFARHRLNAGGCTACTIRIFFAGGITVEKGALTSLYCACEPGIEQHSGKYFSESKLNSPLGLAKDDAKAKALWQLSEKFIESAAAKNV